MPSVRYAIALNSEPVRPNAFPSRPSSGARRQIASNTLGAPTSGQYGKATFRVAVNARPAAGNN